jgi:glycosyltransferase involved in cell wall biosynthesis
VILQFGATFSSPARDGFPYLLYCDSNVRVAQTGAATGFSSTSRLTASEVDRIAAREQTVYDGALAVFTLSEHLRRSFLTDFRLSPDRVITVGAGPNFDVSALPERLARSGLPPTVLFVGGEFHRKGGDLLLRAFRVVRERIPDARLIVIGPRDLKIDQPGVECLGFLRKDRKEELGKLLRAYEEAHVFCLPTRFEPFGIAYLEAMFYSLPCVGPDAWAVPEMVRDGETGYTFPPEDVGALTDRLLRLLEHPDEAFQLGVAGRRYAESRFTWQTAVGAMRSTMLDMVGPVPKHRTDLED